MRSTVRFVGVLCAMLVASALLGGCSTDDGALDNTFSCSGSPCDNCLRSGTGGIIQCSSIAIGSTRATTVNVRN